MNLPIYEQTRRTVPCVLLCDNTTAKQVEPSTNPPLLAARPDEMRGIVFAVAAMVVMLGALALILWLAAGVQP